MSRTRFAGLRRILDGVRRRPRLSRPPAALHRLGLDPGPGSPGGSRAGGVQIPSGDATVGGTKAYITSEFAVAMQLSIFTMLFYGFFVAVAAGMTIIQDEEWRLGELLHATPLRPGEYVWGKFAAVLAACVIVLGFHLAAMMFFNHVLPERRGPGVSAGRSRRRTTSGRPSSSRCRRSSSSPGSPSRSASGRAGRSRSSCCPVLIVLVDGVLPLGMVAELARPADRSRPDADRPGRVPLAE